MGGGITLPAPVLPTLRLSHLPLTCGKQLLGDFAVLPSSATTQHDYCVYVEAGARAFP